jgi:hypothetical protein
MQPQGFAPADLTSFFTSLFVVRLNVDARAPASWYPASSSSCFPGVVDVVFQLPLTAACIGCQHQHPVKLLTASNSNEHDVFLGSSLGQRDMLAANGWTCGCCATG